MFTAYDVHDNSDLFFKEAPDGVNVIIVGYFGKYKDILVIVGGNSSVLALNWEGTEHFWNVVTGKVCSMIILDFDKDGENEVSKGFTYYEDYSYYFVNRLKLSNIFYSILASHWL